MRKRPAMQGAFFMLCGFGLDREGGYPGGCSAKYINDFSNISIINGNISTIISIYQRFDKEYRFVDKIRQKKILTYPKHFIRTEND